MISSSRTPSKEDSLPELAHLVVLWLLVPEEGALGPASRTDESCELAGRALVVEQEVGADELVAAV